MTHDFPPLEQLLTSVEQHKHAINAMIEKYSAGLDGPIDGVLPSSPAIQPAVVLLTGSTGGIGSFLLSALLRNPTVQRVYAFNRPNSKKSIKERQISAFEGKGLAINLLDSIKLVYVEADASLDKCGLSPTLYEEIRNSVTLIIHNAWLMNFRLGMASFEENIRASRNLVDLGLDSHQKDNLRFLFTSSIASALAWDNSNGPFPEEVQLDPFSAVGLGYGEAKYAAERIIVKSGLHATSLRIGQIAGGPVGSRSTTDWLSGIFKSIVVLGAIPESVGVASVLREDEVASVILEVALAKETPPPALNLVNPRGAPCTEIVAFVRRAIIKRMGYRWKKDDLLIIPFQDWLSLLDKTSRNASKDDLAKIPAIKLLKFLRLLAWREQLAIQTVASDQGGVTTEVLGLPNASTTKAQQISPTMTNMQAIGEAEVDAWVGHLISKGVLSEFLSAPFNRARL